MYNRDFSFEISDVILQDIKRNKCKLVFDYTQECYDCTHSNNSDLANLFIVNTVKRYKLEKDQVILLGGNLRPFKDVPYTVCTLNKWLTITPPLSKELAENHTDLIKASSIRKYKILSLMRAPRNHRLKFAFDIFSNNFRDDNLITCQKEIPSDSGTVFTYQYKNFSNEDFVKSLPWEYDNISDVSLAIIPVEELFLSSYIHFVIETHLDHTSNYNSEYELDISEKTIKPISQMQPFVVLGQEGILQHLHNEGYKTFDRWWDESYDTELDSNIRYNKVWELFKYINSLSRQQLSNMLLEMHPILEHNRLLYEEKFKSKQHLHEFNETLIKLFDK